MKRPKLYLETSVWNFYFADDAPEKREITQAFFDKIRQGGYEIFVSDVVIEEIGRANDEKKKRLLNIIKEYDPKRLTINEEVMELSQKYILEEVFSANKVEDAIHAAVATVH